MNLTVMTKRSNLKPINMYDQIIDVICNGEKITFDQINVDCRDGDLVFVRQLIMYFARKKKVGSLAVIGRRFNKDHATVLHAERSIENYIATDKEKRKKVEEYNKKLNRIKVFIEKRDELTKLIEPLKEDVALLEYRLVNIRLTLDNLLNYTNIMIK